MPEVSGDLITRNYSNFRGVDFSNTEVALYRSPDAINMWKDYKKMGTSIETRPDIVLFKELKNTVYGLFFYTINQVDHMIIHCGVSLYDYNMKTKELKIIKEKGMNIRKSQSFIYRNILYIKDGLNYLQYDGETCKEVIGYIPTTTIGKAPSGGGTTNQEVNLLTGVRENSFCADGESTEYVLDASELDAGYQEKVFINNVEKTEGFTVDKVSGKVNFTTAPEKPLTDGQDNVVIRFSKTIPGNRDKINKCTILEVFDNRVFFSGNQDYPNTVFHTMLDEPKYCSDLDYYNEGADISPVRGMVAGNNALWVIKEPSQANTAIFYHNPTIDSEAGKVYPSEHSSISTGCIGAAINFNDDIVYFSNRGMEGISGDITTEQVISHRSSLVDSKLLQEENYKDMILVEYEGYLLVIIKDKIYLADSRAMFTNENHNEYEWFYWNIDIEPTCAVVYNGELWLGSKQGIFKIGKASENNKEISMKKDEEERYFIDGVTEQETGAESYKAVTGKEILIEDGENNKGLEIKVKGSTTQKTSTQSSNLFDEEYYNNDDIYTTGIYKYVKARFTGNRTLYFKATLKEGKTAQKGSYIAISESKGSPAGTKTAYAISNGSAITNSIDFSEITDIYVNIYPNTLKCATIFDNYNLWVSTDNVTYEKFVPDSPSPDYPSEIENIEGRNKFNINGELTQLSSSLTPTRVEGNRVITPNDEYNSYGGLFDYIAVKPNENINISFDLIQGTARIGLRLYDKDKNIINSSNVNLPNFHYIAYYQGYYYSGTNISTVIPENVRFIKVFTICVKGTEENIYENLQIEKGNKRTPYVPYNSLEFKVEGKNLFDVTLDSSITNKIQYKTYKLEPNTKYTISTNTYLSNDVIANIFIDLGTSLTPSTLTNGVNGSKTITTDSTGYVTIGYRNNSMQLDYSTGMYYCQLEKGQTATDYEPYKSQVVTFPLGEEKLMEGSYLADDGIHHSRKQVTLDGTEEYNTYLIGTGRYQYTLKITGHKVNRENPNVYSSHFKAGVVGDRGTSQDNIVYSTDVGISFKYNSATTLEEWKAFVTEQYANGTPVIVEYELAEPETVLYTEEQQEAWNKIESMKLYDGVNHIESTSEIDIKYNYIYKKPSIKNKSNIENKISSGEYQTIINNKRYFVFLEEELKSVRNDITDRLYIDTNKNIAKVMKRVDKLVLNGTEEWNVNTTHSNVFYTAKPKNMADNETNIFCTITDEFSKDLSGETYGILIDTNINIKIPKVKTVADLKAYLAKEPITIQYKATEEIKDIILLSKPSSYWTTCEDEFKYPQMQKTTNKRGCVADVIGEEIDVFCKTNKEQFEKIATHKNATGYAVNRIKKKKWKSIQLKFSSNKSFELFSCTLESYIGSYIKR